jgi:diguanylate cyclase (GGDEF)-like protein
MHILVTAILLAACSFIPHSRAAFAPPQKLVVVTDDNYPPYLFRSQAGELQGIVKDKWELWSRRTGVPVEVRGIDWVSAQREVRSDAADVIEAFVYTPARAQDYDFSRADAKMEARIFFHHELTGIRDAASLKGFRVGAKAGSACSDWLRARGVESIDTYPNSEAVVRAAAAGEILAFCMDSLVAHYFLYKLDVGGDYRQSTPLYAADFHWAVRGGRSALRDYVQAGFDRIPARELREIESRWLGDPVQFPISAGYRYAAAALVATILGFAALLFAWNRALRLRLEARARLIDTRDALTNLPNRKLLHDRLVRTLAHARTRDWLVAVLFVDLDRFKAFNESFGRAFGDRVLREVAARLAECVGRRDVVGRMSSDEFAVVLSQLAKEEDAAVVARRILDQLHRAFDLDGHRIYCTASIGIAFYPRDGSDAGALIRNADMAMYRAKELGRNNFQLYQPEMHTVAVRRLELETALRGALERDEFVIHYQPRIDVETLTVCGLEALLRWRHPQHGMLSPGEFIPILEETDLIVEVGEWVLASVCRQIRDWEARGIRPRPVAVNLSARQFRQKDLHAVVARIIAESGIHPSLLELELTESLLMADPEKTVRTLEHLESDGVRIAVDDFGTGYSSLAYLRRFPIHALKIDRSFIRDATTNPEDAAITHAIIDLAHSLGLTVVAEGVETEGQLDLLRAHGCDEIQGFIFSPPVIAGEIELLLDTGTLQPRR